jgi:hypothetical protein
VPSRRAVLFYAGALLAAFALAFAVGYAYQYGPERDLVSVVVEEDADIPRDEAFQAGTVTEVNGQTATILTASGSVEVDLSSVALEALRSLPSLDGVQPGAQVNLGGERTGTERVISGIVIFEDGATP